MVWMAEGSVFDFRHKHDIFLFSIRPIVALEPTRPIMQWQTIGSSPRLSNRGAMLIPYLYLIPRLWMAELSYGPTLIHVLKS
jgi:hypothetical protein